MVRQFFHRVRHSFRYKLLLLVLLPLVIFIPLIIVFSLHRTYSFAEEQLYHKVHTDINVAQASFVRQQQKHLDAVSRLAESHAFQTALNRNDTKEIRNQLQLLKVTENLDFAHVVDLKGGWLFDETVFKGEAKPSALISDAVHSGVPKVGLALYESAYLIRERHALAKRARVLLQEEPGGEQAARFQSDALVLRAVHPIRNEQGQIVSLLESGKLINENTALIKNIGELVYGPGTLPEHGKGLISVICGDVRIATNLTGAGKDGEHWALGAPVSRTISQNVLEQGKRWVGEVNTPGGIFLSAYQPLYDYQQNIVGMLETGYLAAPLKKAYQRDVVLFILILLLVVMIATALAIRGASRIFRPIESMAQVVQAQEAGQDERIGKIDSQDEIGALARRFDHLLDLLHERNAEIQRAADNLETQVNERTKELQLKNAYLKNTIDLLSRTRRQLVMAEKFAALGELTAGIAHEINNPTAVILGNMDILVDELGRATDPVTTEVSLIYEQVYRIRTIVEKLLKYSRASPMNIKLHAVDVGKLVEDTLLLVNHEVQRKHARIEHDLAANCVVQIDPQELQQVLINLLINAIHAIDEGGVIEIGVFELDYGDVCVRIRDNGTGIDPEVIDRIFDPFYSTKGNEGTGLGLSVSYGLIHRYGGNLEVDSKPGRGSVFTIHLQREPQTTPQLHTLFDLHSHQSTRKSETFYE